MEIGNELKQLNKEIRRNILEERKQSVRRQIRPGSAKSLWDSVKIARNEGNDPLPSEMYLGETNYKGEEIPEAFADYFKWKVENITAE